VTRVGPVLIPEMTVFLLNFSFETMAGVGRRSAFAGRGIELHDCVGQLISNVIEYPKNISVRTLDHCIRAQCHHRGDERVFNQVLSGIIRDKVLEKLLHGNRPHGSS
jgi:hypothetical protein